MLTCLMGTLWVLSLNLACTTEPPTPETNGPEGQEQITSQPPPGMVDLAVVEHQLNMERPANSLGFDERLIDSCQFGSSDALGGCGSRYFVLIHFLLQCRDTEGTQANLGYGIQPVHARSIRWQLGGLQGSTSTDSAGYGQIRFLASSSTRKRRIKLITAGNFLLETAGEIDRIVAPVSWCNSR